MLEVIGWIGSILLAFCALPQAIESFKKGSSEGVTWGLIFMWGLGEILTLLYVLPKNELPLIINYLVNILLIVIILYYKVFQGNNMVSLAILAAVIVFSVLLVGPFTYILKTLNFPKIIVKPLSFLCIIIGCWFCIIGLPIWYIGLIPVFFGVISLKRQRK